MKKLLLITCSLLMISSLYAQHKVSGTIMDSDNQALIGVNVSEKGTANGTIFVGYRPFTSFYRLT